MPNCACRQANPSVVPIMPVQLRLPPPQLALSGSVLRNPIRQYAEPHSRASFDVEPTAHGHVLTREDGWSCLVTDRLAPPPDGFMAVLHSPEGGSPAESAGGDFSGEWLMPPPLDPGTLDLDEARARCEAVLDSFRGWFTFREERRSRDAVVEVGLRPPQVGALYAVLAHWKTTDAPATVVMPTGTGKTETMLAIMAWERPTRLLVVVPGDRLREQVSDKFLGMGLLRDLGVLGSAADHPVVGLLRHVPRDAGEVDEVFLRCNVVVSSMHVGALCSEAVKARMAEVCSHLFIGETHHVPARSWTAFRQHFARRPIVQFTATPFRRDGKHVDGRLVFNYPLRKAQAEGYFKPVSFQAVDAVDRGDADREIATLALARLRADLDEGRRHLVMARTDNVSRAEGVIELYRELGPEFEPVVMHHRLMPGERDLAIRRLRSGESRVVVCVDMLGEGFDLPELKIAALHDVHKSLAITLQFTGRFTRFRADLGDATVIANVADPRVEEALQELYAEDADWNIVLRELSEGATGRQHRRSDLLAGFGAVPEEVSLRNVFPKMSAVVYHTDCEGWRPNRFEEGIGTARLHWGPVINKAERLMLFITEELEAVPWGNIKHLTNRVWHVYVVHWDEARGLVYVNSSNNGTDHEGLVEAIVGPGAELIKGERVFRSLHGINRLVLTNLGLSDVVNQNIRFSMHVAGDISDALPLAMRESKKKTNLFSSGYENGIRVTAGCSQKGRMWSYRIAYDLAEWLEWCHGIGAKLIDETIDTDAVFRGVILPRPVTGRPALVAIAIEWPETFLARGDDLVQVDVDGQVVPFFEASLEVVGFADEGPVRFHVTADGRSATYLATFGERGVSFEREGTARAEVLVGRRKRDLAEWFAKDPPVLRFANGASVEHDQIFEPPSTTERRLFDRDRIEVFDWTGVDIRSESQTQEKRPDSIQRRVLTCPIHRGESVGLRRRRASCRACGSGRREAPSGDCSV